MTRIARLLALVQVLLLAGCGPAAVGSPSNAGSTGNPTASATASALPTMCPIAGGSGSLPSNRLVDVRLETGPTSDRVSFLFGPEAVSVGGEPLGSLSQAEPPFSIGSSGAVIDVAGTRFLEIRFTGVVIADESGSPTFVGRRDQEVEFPALRHLTMYDESEGIVGWYVGIDGPGCSTMTFEPAAGEVRLEIGHS